MQNAFHKNDGLLITSEDDFEIVTLYPQAIRNSPCNSPVLNVASTMLPYSLTPNMSPYPLKSQDPIRPTLNIDMISSSTQSMPVRESCHPLQGIPFKLAPMLELSQNVQQDPDLQDVKRTLERVKNLLDSKDFDYDFTLERNFLRDMEQQK